MVELLFAALVFGVIIYIAVGVFGSADAPPANIKAPPPAPKTIPPRATAKPKRKTPNRPHAHMPEIEGRAYVVDGDSLVINKTEIRIYGVDAPELNHPWGQKAKWAMVALCKGHNIRARIVETDDHGRTVAMCYLPDGRDLSAEMVKQGLALDWPKFSQGDYRTFEPPGVRKKLWLADARQKGRMHVWDQFEERRKANTTQAK
ncbi:MAG: thermonuclease family protein [Pseudomonadota bacterium]